MNQAHLEQAIFAGGCFWCLESDMDSLPGVVETISGYTGGHKDNPTYKEVSAGGTGHAESVKVTFDPSRISYDQLLDAFWRFIDPTTRDAQFCDHGHQYRTAIFYMNDAQKAAAERSLAQLEETKPFKDPIVTEITPAAKFYPAEDYHQNYYKKNPLRYRFYRYSCGRDSRLEALWSQAPH
ncbi:MAG: peptide-methionine (S)-S-oxide reductase MsrA [Gammaproteobacteria bacterium]|nr:peptide-methionine (S)-S-oxide reductase MsrA [Gammaproteobacteria bacterium]